MQKRSQEQTCDLFLRKYCNFCTNVPCYVDCQTILKEAPLCSFFLTPSLILRQWKSRWVIPVREWALQIARRSTGITHLRAIKPDSAIWKHPTLPIPIPFPYVTRWNNLYPACYSWSKATRDLLAIRVQAPNPITRSPA
jgi:hypothetical protein